MPILGERFYQMSNAIFCYDLKPIPLAVYSYLVCCAGQKDLCWPSIKTIALHCNCSENAARDAVKQLVERGFIRKVATKQMRRDGSWRQSNNHYYILPLPAFPTAGYRAGRGLRRRRWSGNVSTRRSITNKNLSHGRRGERISSEKRNIQILRRSAADALGSGDAAALGISRARAYELARSEGFPALRIGTRIVIPKDEPREWIKRNMGKQETQ